MAQRINTKNHTPSRHDDIQALQHLSVFARPISASKKRTVLPSPEAVFAFLDETRAVDLLGGVIARYATKHCANPQINVDTPAFKLDAQRGLLGRIVIDRKQAEFKTQPFTLELDLHLEQGNMPYARLGEPTGDYESFICNTSNGEITNGYVLPQAIGLAAISLSTAIQHHLG